ncbi:Yip1-domain-containing protein [Sanghuangporus baumii]|uniref:Yip1-domain-containing protein n=1 Tax=Sanghuangporus baumii TaxID=108892 RepID=A0A9Q5N7R9_SANBA|nr:Yip1-domain-containing protein [Sanghuangporus baumii]
MDPHTPNTATSQFIQAVATETMCAYAMLCVDDDDYDEDALPSFGGELDQNQNSTSATSLGVKGKGRAQPYSTTGGGGGGGGGSSNSNSQGLSGNIGSGVGTGGRGGAGQQGSRRTVGGVRVETRYTGVDTLDEPVTATIARDLRSISVKIAQVLYPSRSGAGREVLR